MCDYDYDRIFEIESALELLGLEKCDYCSEWDKKANYKKIKLGKVEGVEVTKTCCTGCQQEYKKDK
jgi:hypothetical protein